MKSISLRAMALSALLMLCASVQAQEIEEVDNTPKTLFEYPQCPDTISTFESRANYFVQHFWDNCDLSKPVREHRLFAQAFNDYAQFFILAHRQIVITSIRNFLFKAQSNIKNLEFIMALAEQTLYYPTSSYCSDEAYTEFVNVAVANKALSSELRNNCQRQLARIKATPDSVYMGNVEYVDFEGKKHKLKDVEANRLLIFVNSDEHNSIERLRLSTSANLNKLIERGDFRVMSISVEKYSRNWAESARTYPENWVVGSSPDFVNNYDVRLVPGIFVLDGEKRLLVKNLDFESTKRNFDNMILD